MAAKDINESDIDFVDVDGTVYVTCKCLRWMLASGLLLRVNARVMLVLCPSAPCRLVGQSARHGIPRRRCSAKCHERPVAHVVLLTGMYCWGGTKRSRTTVNDCGSV